MSGLVELGRYSDAALAHILRARLESSGIHAVCFDSGMNVTEGVPMLIGVRLMVLDENLQEARKLLDERTAVAEQIFGDDEFDEEIFADDPEQSPEELPNYARRRSRLLMWGAILLGSALLLPTIFAGLAN